MTWTDAIVGTQSWSPANATIKVEKYGTAGSVQTITTEVTNFSDGGGDKTTDTIAHFGGAYLIVKKPQADYEVEFQTSASDSRWFEMLSGNLTEVVGSFRLVKSGGAQNPYKIKVEWLSPDNSEAFKILYYGAYAVTVKKDNAADDRLTSTISFKVSPSDANGSPQKFEVETRDRTSAGVGSSATGSYGSWEKYYDTLFGYGAGSML
jgi:hypothetical protein